MSSSTDTTAADRLREVPLRLRAQWKAMVASRATVLRWTLSEDEHDWVEEFLVGRLDGVSKVFVIEEAADDVEGYGFAAGRPLMTKLAATRLPGRGAWASPPIARGTRDVDALAAILGSFARHAHGTWVEHVGVVLAPERVRDMRAWLAWVEAFAGALLRFAPSVRIVLLDDVARPRYEHLARYHDAVCTTRADLGIARRIAEMAEQACDTGTTEGQIRVLTVRAMQCVNEGRVADAERLAIALEALAHETRSYIAVVPVRFAVAGALLAEKRFADAVRSYRAAELAAERAEAAADPNGPRLRITARLGVAAGLLASPGGAPQAARYYAETAPLCAALGDKHLELESHRCAAVAHEIARAYRPAWDATVKALGIVDTLTDAQRESAMLVPLADAMLRLAQMSELAPYRAAIEHELRKRKMRGSQWA